MNSRAELFSLYKRQYLYSRPAHRGTDYHYFEGIEVAIEGHNKIRSTVTEKKATNIIGFIVIKEIQLLSNVSF